ncbi:hypothetical protein [Mycobacterium marinum]
MTGVMSFVGTPAPGPTMGSDQVRFNRYGDLRDEVPHSAEIATVAHI